MARRHAESDKIKELVAKLESKIDRELYTQRRRLLVALNGCRGDARRQLRARRAELLQLRRTRRAKRDALHAAFKAYDLARGKFKEERATFLEMRRRILKDNAMRKKELHLISKLFSKLGELVNVGNGEATADLQAGTEMSEGMWSEMNSMLADAESMPDMADIVTAISRQSGSTDQIGDLLKSVKAKILKEIKDAYAHLKHAHGKLQDVEIAMERAQSALAPAKSALRVAKHEVHRKQREVDCDRKKIAELDSSALRSKAAGGAPETAAEKRAREETEKADAERVANEKAEEDKLEKQKKDEDKEEEESMNKFKSYKIPTEEPALIFLSKLGSCPSNHNYGYVYTYQIASSAQCQAMGGKPLGSGSWKHCKLSVCGSNSGNRDSVTGHAIFENRVGKCQKKLAYGIIGCKTAHCDTLGGRYNGKPAKDALTQCHIDFCGKPSSLKGYSFFAGISKGCPSGSETIGRSVAFKSTTATCHHLGGEYKSGHCTLDVCRHF
mmetsp:Transcript_16249/g.38698  ORF Transcript_16249/g.38698 Transcript_16249/m.38698 type:complete len:498 (+) Transcript_16249:152-1645(+)